MKVAILFDHFGPYHLTRLEAVAPCAELLAVEAAERSAEYAWQREAPGVTEKEPHFKHVMLCETGTSREISSHELKDRLSRVLEDFKPQVMFVPGWSSKAAFFASSWCIRHQVPIVAMSESTEWDEKRSAWREAIKRQVVGLYSAALVGGAPHKDYMVKLGMPPKRVFPGYDAVDNEYFAGKVEEVRSRRPEVRKKLGLPENYFLASARFIEKKNLPRLMEAYALYRKKADLRSPSSRPWSLVLLGDGALRPALSRLISDLRLEHGVLLPGFKQYAELPAYYGLANAFIHASTTEPWGLVVNEAMASGLPVLVSNRCGCAADLVQEGVNGFTFDPHNVEQLAELMLKISDSQFPIPDFGAASARRVADWGPQRFAQGWKAAAECALQAEPKKSSWLQRMILQALMLR
jgi:1,2-diacylglycerol 3-alpha-glucosyltransferase